MDFNKLASTILDKVGGAENIAGLTHCATRLRFTLKDEQLADIEAIKKTEGVLGAINSGGVFQVIIGNQVPKAYAALADSLKNEPVSSISTETSADSKKKSTFSEAFFGFVSAVFTPILPAIIGAGLIKSVLALAVLLGMDATSPTYHFMNLIGDAPLYFLPIMLAFTASKKLNCNQFLAVSIAGAMLHPNYTSLITDMFSLNYSSFFGVPVTLASYGASVIPVLLMVFALKYVDLALDRIIPNMLKFFFKPLLTLLIVAFVTFVALGPLGFIIGVGMSNGLDALDQYAGWLAPTIIATVFPLMVTTGMHYGLVPPMMQSLASRGYETIGSPASLPSNIAQGAASLCVAIRTKDTTLKQTAFTTGATALLGITEPALFSVTLKYKRVLASVMIGGGLGGLYAGIMGVRCYSFISPGLLSLVAFVGPDGLSNIMHASISMVISFVATFALVWVWGYQDVAFETTETVPSSGKRPLAGEER